MTKHPRSFSSAAALFLSALVAVAPLFRAVVEAGCSRIPGNVRKEGGCGDSNQSPSGIGPCAGSGGGGTPSGSAPYTMVEEGIELCPTGKCGSLSPRPYSETVSSGEEECYTSDFVPSPGSDCGNGDNDADDDGGGGEGGDGDSCGGGPDSGGTGSLWFKMRLASATSQRSASYLWIYQKDAAPRLYTPAVLTLPGDEGLKVYRNPDHTIRQILSADTLADIVVLSPEAYEVRMHPLPAGWERRHGADGYLEPPGEPARTYRFANPDPGQAVRLRIDTVSGAGTRTREFGWDLGEGRWSLLGRAGGTLRLETLEHYDPATHALVKTSRRSDLATGSRRDTVRTFRDTPQGRFLLSVEQFRDDRLLSGETRSYGEDPADPATYGRLVSRQFHDGRWVRYGYGPDGRLSKIVRPWKDSPFGSPDREARVESYSYPALPPASVHYHPTARFVRIDESVAGVPVSTVYRLRTRDRADGGALHIEERAAAPGVRFGAEGSARTTKRYYPEREADPASGMLRSTESPDGSLAVHRYENGDYDGGEAMPGLFVPRVGGPYLRTTKVETTAAHPGGVPDRSLVHVSIESPSGDVVLEQTRLLGGEEPAEGELLAWTGHAYDAEGRRVLSRDATGILGEYRYSACCAQLEWERGRDGTETSYVHDADGRVTAQIVKAPGRPEVETHYEHGAFGQVLRETVVAGDLVRETRHEYDEEGERIATTGPDGLTTRHQHDRANRTHTTTLPGGATRIETRYLDGQIRSVTGTSQVAQHYDYGVDAATGDLWTKTYAAKPDSPRWSRSVTDALGRSVAQESPGHGEGVVLASHTAYDGKGRVVATQGEIQNPKLEIRRALGPATLQTYDEETGEPLLAGQDLDNDGQLVPGKDRVAKSERRHEEIEGAWWEVARQWSYPLGLKGEPYLVGESRQRLTGLGKAHEDPTLGVLVAESVRLLPAENSKLNTDKLIVRNVTYRNRETGLITAITTDPNGLVTVQKTEGGLLASVESFAADGREAIGQTAKQLTAFAYDALSRRVSVTDPRTGESTTTYDPKTGRVVAEADPEGRITRYAYYPADHPSAGRLATVADAAGKEQHVAYTLRGEQRAVWGDNTQPILHDYNDYGERISMRTFQTLPDGDPSHHEEQGARTAWHYDEATGALLRKEYADGQGPGYVYTEAGQIESRTWARDLASVGQALRLPSTSPSVRPETRLTTAYEYNEKTLQLAKSTATDGLEVIQEYDAENRPSKVTDATGTREFAYDLRGQIVKETITLLTGADTPPIRYELRRTYTPLGQPGSVHLVSAEGESVTLDHKVGYEWNTHGVLASVTSLAGEFAYEYDPANPALLAKMTGPAHIVETTYEPHRNLIIGVMNRRKSGTGILPASPDPAVAGNVIPATGSQLPAPISSYAYTNDILGRREAISQGGEAFAMLKLGDTKVDVAYNDRSEVVGTIYKTGNETRQQFTYSYDGIGNRREAAKSWVTGQGTREEERTIYTANALNQYTEIKSDSASSVNSVGKPTHDPDGNLIDDTKNRYEWDSENRLVRVEAKDGKTRVEYVHDYQGRRTIRRAYSRAGEAENWQLKTENFYLYDGWNVLAELDFSLSPSPSVSPSREKSAVRFFTWGRDLSGDLQGAGGAGGLLAVTELGKNEGNPSSLIRDSRFFLFDANGNISQLVDESGEITAAYVYDPFGNVTEMAGPEAEKNQWRFSTKPMDGATGWAYYGFRYYQPETGRWLSRDPIGEQGGINLYGFVGNQPTGRVDILGAEWEEIGNAAFRIKIPITEVGILAGGGLELTVFHNKDTCCHKIKYKLNREAEIGAGGKIELSIMRYIKASLAAKISVISVGHQAEQEVEICQSGIESSSGTLTLYQWRLGVMVNLGGMITIGSVKKSSVLDVGAHAQGRGGFEIEIGLDYSSTKSSFNGSIWGSANLDVDYQVSLKARGQNWDAFSWLPGDLEDHLAQGLKDEIKPIGWDHEALYQFSF